MKSGDKVVCIDDEYWLLPDEGGPAPIKGGIYCVRDTCKFGPCLGVSLVGFHPDDYFRANRFRPVVNGSTISQFNGKEQCQ